MTTQSLLLLGENYNELGPVTIAELPGRGAVALSRGAFPKSYRYVDPNEDAVLLVTSSDGVLIAVADGFNGVDASHFVMESLITPAPELIRTKEQAFRERFELFVVEMSAALESAGMSRTCLVVAAICGDTCSWASMGDSSLFRSSCERPVSIANDIAVGPGLLSLPPPYDAWSGSFTPLPGERIAVVSDGVTNFVSPLTDIAKLLGSAASDGEAAHALTTRAMSGGAGDNVCASVISLP